MITHTYTDCGTPTTTRVCREHNVRDCATCIKRTSACTWGGCHEVACATLTARSRATGRVAEVRRLCIPHLAPASQVLAREFEYEAELA